MHTAKFFCRFPWPEFGHLICINDVVGWEAILPEKPYAKISVNCNGCTTGTGGPGRSLDEGAILARLLNAKSLDSIFQTGPELLRPSDNWGSGRKFERCQKVSQIKREKSFFCRGRQQQSGRERKRNETVPRLRRGSEAGKKEQRERGVVWTRESEASS